MPLTGHLSDVPVYTRTTAYRHASIPAARTALREPGEEEGFTVETSEDPAVFTDASLIGRGAVVFLSTSGDVLTEEGPAAQGRGPLVPTGPGRAPPAPGRPRSTPSPPRPGGASARSSRWSR